MIHIDKEYYDKIVPTKPLTESQIIKFETQKNCHICEKPFSNLSIEVMDHDHLTGQFRGAAQDYWNLNYKNPRYIPILFHNLAGYNVHLFILQFSADDNDIKLISNTEKKVYLVLQNFKI